MSFRKIGRNMGDDEGRGHVPRAELRRRRIGFRTAHLPATSSVLYRMDHYSSMAGVTLGVVIGLVAVLLIGASLGFPQGWLSAFEVATSTVTILMVFMIQHTQGREQAATQRKLDELLKALPGAEDSFMVLEEAPQEVLLEIEEDQRRVRSESQARSQ
jgi:low affinity Fe/Cu permease